MAETVETYDLEVQAGATFRRVFEWTEEDGTPIPLAGKAARMQIRAGYGGAVLLDSEEAGSGLTLTLEPGGALGEIHLKIGATKTSDLTKGVYDLEVYDPSDADEVDRLVSGKVTVSKEVTT